MFDACSAPPGQGVWAALGRVQAVPGAAEAAKSLAKEGEDPPDRMRSLGTAGAMAGKLGEGERGWCGAVTGEG
jgi:hypothetical protein